MRKEGREGCRGTGKNRGGETIIRIDSEKRIFLVKEKNEKKNSIVYLSHIFSLTCTMSIKKH